MWPSLGWSLLLKTEVELSNKIKQTPAVVVVVVVEVAAVGLRWTTLLAGCYGPVAVVSFFVAEAAVDTKEPGSATAAFAAVAALEDRAVAVVAVSN